MDNILTCAFIGLFQLKLEKGVAVATNKAMNFL